MAGNASKHARIKPADAGLVQDLVDALYTRASLRTSGPVVLGALVVAATRLPIQVVKALVEGYNDYERQRDASGSPSGE